MKRMFGSVFLYRKSNLGIDFNTMRTTNRNNNIHYAFTK